MIGLFEATKRADAAGLPPLLHKASLQVEKGQHVGILAAAGSGKTTIAEILCGIRDLDDGLLTTNGTVSWPLGFSGAMHPHLSARENSRLIACVNRANPDDVDVFCQSFSRLGAKYDSKLAEYSSSERAIAAFSLSLAIRFDIYIIDETFAVGDQQFRDRCEVALKARLRAGTSIAFSRNARSLQSHCTHFMLLNGGKFIPCRSAEHAIALNKQAGVVL